MIQHQIKLKPNAAQTKLLAEWFNICTGIWNWAIKKIKMDWLGGIWHSQFQFNNILAGHSQRLGLPSSTIQGVLTTAWKAWKECYKKNKHTHPSKWAQPRFKGFKRPMTSLPLPDPKSLKIIDHNHVRITKLGLMRFHAGRMPAGKIKCARILRRQSGYYLCLIIDSSPQKLICQPKEFVGIDPGFKDLLSLSTGEKLNGPDEINRAILKTEARLAQANRGRDYKLVRRLNERLSNQKKLRNHILSKDLVQRFEHIAFSVDNEAGMAKTRMVKNKSGQKVKRKSFGKSVARATHFQLRQMIKYKSAANGRAFLEVPGKNTTRRCSACLDLTGPTGRAELGVREWICSSCGAQHDRDTNAAVNTLIASLTP